MSHEPLQSQDEAVSGNILRVLFSDKATGFCIVSAQVGTEQVAIKGTWPNPRAGAEVEASGRWVTHPKYGRQFEADAILEVLPNDNTGIIAYLKDNIPGIGSSMAADIVKKFGENTYEILDSEPSQLLTIKGIGKLKLEKIKAGWEKNRGIYKVMVFLRGIGLGPQLAAKVHRELSKDGADPIRQISDNPYVLSSIPGIGFLKADLAAQRLGVPPDSIFRIEEGLIHVLNEEMSNGHTVLQEDLLISRASEILSLNAAIIRPVAASMMIEKSRIDSVILEGDSWVGLSQCLAAERGIKVQIERIITSSHGQGQTSAQSIDEVIKDAPFTLAHSQRAALARIVPSFFSILTGGPGMGKTTITKYAIKAWEEDGKKVRLCAPTGRAAKQLAAATGREAQTIHRLLNLGHQNSDDSEPIDADLVVVDESSMMDVFLANKLFKRVKPGAGVLLVGDVDQLPSVGCGNVLRDIIDSNVVPVARLTEIFRQADGSGIATGAQQILRGRIPQFNKQDFKFICQSDAEVAANLIVDGVARTVQRGFNPLDIQVLAPMHKGPLGVSALNSRLHDALNPRSPRDPKLVVGGTEFRRGSRIMQTKNNYELDLYNGDQGVVTEVDEEDKSVKAKFDDKEVTLSNTDLLDTNLCYAITIHKSQGGQFKLVILAAHNAHWIMLNKNLLYTGVTRSQEKAVVVGTNRALAKAVRTEANMTRKTTLLHELISNRQRPEARIRGGAEMGFWTPRA